MNFCSADCQVFRQSEHYNYKKSFLSVPNFECNVYLTVTHSLSLLVIKEQMTTFINLILTSQIENRERIISHSTVPLLSSPSPKSKSPNPSQRTWGDTKIPWATNIAACSYQHSRLLHHKLKLLISNLAACSLLHP